jgi:hypothetical protein
MLKFKPLPSNDYCDIPYYQDRFKKTTKVIRKPVIKGTCGNSCNYCQKLINEKNFCKLPTKNTPCKIPPRKIYSIESHSDDLKKTLNNLNIAFNNLNKKKKNIKPKQKKLKKKLKKLENEIITLRQTIDSILRIYSGKNVLSQPKRDVQIQKQIKKWIR